MAGESERTFNWIGGLMLGLLALLSLACIGVGGFFYVWILIDWVQGSGGFTGLQMIGWIFGLIAAAIIGLGLLLGGIFLRLLRWIHAPLASLLLSVMSTGFIIATYLVFSDTGNGSDSIEVVLLQAGCILGLFALSLPPFLHWMFVKPGSPSAAGSLPVNPDVPKVL